MRCLCIDVHHMHWIAGKIYTEAPVDSTVLLCIVWWWKKNERLPVHCMQTSECEREREIEKKIEWNENLKYWWSLPFKRRTMIWTIIGLTVHLCQIGQYGIIFHRFFFLLRNATIHTKIIQRRKRRNDQRISLHCQNWNETIRFGEIHVGKWRR